MAAGEGGVTSAGIDKDNPSDLGDGESSESEVEGEPGKPFHRRISTNREIKCSVRNKLIIFSLKYFLFAHIISGNTKLI